MGGCPARQMKRNFNALLFDFHWYSQSFQKVINSWKTSSKPYDNCFFSQLSAYCRKCSLTPCLRQPYACLRASGPKLAIGVFSTRNWWKVKKKNIIPIELDRQTHPVQISSGGGIGFCTGMCIGFAIGFASDFLKFAQVLHRIRAGFA